jgi:hypothetical protein
VCAKRDAKAARLLDYQAMGSFERFKTKAHFNSLKQLVGVTALAALAVKLLTVALATAAGGGTPIAASAGPPQALGASWLLIEWDAIRLPAGITSR